MAVITLHLEQPPDAVFEVLGNPWKFADWVVGAKRIRAVDDTWPAIGSRFHHRFGVGPFGIDDSTVLEEYDPPRRIVLRARARPTGVARVEIDLAPTRDGGTDVEMREYPVSGFAKKVDNPVLEALVAARNRRSLRLLEKLTAEAHSTG